MKIEWQRGSPRFAWLHRREAGNSNLTGILIIVFIIIVIITTPPGDKNGWDFAPGTTLSSSSGFSASSNSRSAGAAEVFISTGNATYSYQPYEEYIVLENYGRGPVNITGWQLKNGKDKRPYYLGGSLQRFSADIATIPQATKLLSPSGRSINQDVVLESGDRAIVTSGTFGNRSPYTVTSFKENMCTGYLEDLPDYAFNPPLSRDCPRPAREPGIEGVDLACRKFVEGLSPCETPVFGGKDNEGENCPDCVEGRLLGSICSAFVKEHFSYRGCVAYHAGDPGFSGRTWRLFLGRGWEMWAEEYESIELFDRFGQLVNSQDY